MHGSLGLHECALPDQLAFSSAAFAQEINRVANFVSRFKPYVRQAQGRKPTVVTQTTNATTYDIHL